ncbi:MAG: cupin domain-containing protein [Rhodothermales bacterium]
MRIPLLFLLLVAMTPHTDDAVPSGVYRWDDAPSTPVEGGTRRDLASGSTTALARLSVTAWTLEPGASLSAPAGQDEERLAIVRSGALRVALDDTSATVGRGSVVVALPGEASVLTNAGSTPASFYLFAYVSRQPMRPERGREAGGSLIVDWNDVPFAPHDKGGRRNIMDRATAAFSRLEMHVTTLNEGLVSHPPHTHPAEEFLLPIEGDTRESIDGIDHPAATGDLIFVDSMVRHNIANTGAGATTYFAFQWE